MTLKYKQINKKKKKKKKQKKPGHQLGENLIIIFGF